MYSDKEEEKKFIFLFAIIKKEDEIELTRRSHCREGQKNHSKRCKTKQANKDVVIKRACPHFLSKSPPSTAVI